jgi:hypothetical protein
MDPLSLLRTYLFTFLHTMFWLYHRWPRTLRAREVKILAQIKTAKSLLAAARKVPSIVCCHRDDVHDIKINLYLHYQVVMRRRRRRRTLTQVSLLELFFCSKQMRSRQRNPFSFL